MSARAAALAACALLATVACSACSACGSGGGALSSDGGVDLGEVEDLGPVVDARADGEAGVDAGPQPLRVRIQRLSAEPCADWEVAPLWEPPPGTGEVPELLWVFDPSDDPKAREALRSSFGGEWLAPATHLALSRLGHVWMVGPELGTLSVLDEQGRLLQWFRPGGGPGGAYEALIPHPPVVAPDGSVRAVRRRPDGYLRYRWNATTGAYAQQVFDVGALVGEPFPEPEFPFPAPAMVLTSGGRVLMSWGGTVTELCDTDPDGPPRPLRRFRWYRGEEKVDAQVVAVEADGRMWLSNRRFYDDLLTFQTDADGRPLREAGDVNLRATGPAGQGVSRLDPRDRSVAEVGWLLADGGLERVLTQRVEGPDTSRSYHDPARGIWLQGPMGYTRYADDGTALFTIESWARPEAAVFGPDGSRLLSLRLDTLDGGVVEPRTESLRVLPDGGIAWRQRAEDTPSGRRWYGQGLLGRNGVLVGNTNPRDRSIGWAYAAWRVDVRAPEDFTHAAYSLSNCYRNSWAGSP